MSIRTAAVTLAILAMLAAPALAAPGGVVVVTQAQAGAQLTGTELVLKAGLDRQTAAQNGLAALVAECVLRTPVSGGLALKDAVAAQGGSIQYSVEPRDVRFYLEGLSGHYAQMLADFRQALSKPDFSDATVAASRTALNEKSARAQGIPLRVGIDMLNRQFYHDSNAGMPPYGLPATLAGFSGADAQAFYARNYRRGDAVVSAVGDTSAVPQSAYAALVDGLAAGVSPVETLRIPAIDSTTHELISRRDTPVPWLVAQYPAPQLRSRDFGAMLILTAFVRRTLADVSEVPGVATRSAAQTGVGAYYNFDTHPANVIIYVDGGMGDPTRAFATALTVVNVLGHAKLSGDLTDMKSYAAGQLLEQTTTLQDRAWLAAVEAAQGLKGDYAARAIAAINTTTADDLQRVAKRYLSSPTIALVLPRSEQTVQSQSP